MCDSIVVVIPVYLVWPLLSTYTIGPAVKVKLCRICSLLVVLSDSVTRLSSQWSGGVCPVSSSIVNTRSRSSSPENDYFTPRHDRDGDELTRTFAALRLYFIQFRYIC